MSVPADIDTAGFNASGHGGYTFPETVDSFTTVSPSVARYLALSFHPVVNNSETVSSGVVTITQGQEFPNGVR